MKNMSKEQQFAHDRSLCDRALSDVMGMYKYTLTELEGSVWAKIIDEVSVTAFQAFLQQHILTSEFAPKPSNAAAALGLAGADPQQAYAQLERAVRTVGPNAIPPIQDPVLIAAVHQMGGWSYINETMPDPNGNSFEVKNFKERFEAAYKLAKNEVCIQGLKPVPLVAFGRPAQHIAIEHKESRPEAAEGQGTRFQMISRPGRSA